MGERLRSSRILILENEYFLADDLQRALAAEGAEVIGPISSLRKARGLIDDLLHGAVLDIKLADGDVYSVADELSRKFVPFVFATGYAAATIPYRFQKAPIVEKPYDTRNIVDVVERLCGRRT